MSVRQERSTGVWLQLYAQLGAVTALLPRQPPALWLSSMFSIFPSIDVIVNTGDGGSQNQWEDRVIKGSMMGRESVYLK